LSSCQVNMAFREYPIAEAHAAISPSGGCLDRPEPGIVHRLRQKRPQITARRRLLASILDRAPQIWGGHYVPLVNLSQIGAGWVRGWAGGSSLASGFKVQASSFKLKASWCKPMAGKEPWSTIHETVDPRRRPTGSGPPLGGFQAGGWATEASRRPLLHVYRSSGTGFDARPRCAWTSIWLNQALQNATAQRRA